MRSIHSIGLAAKPGDEQSLALAEEIDLWLRGQGVKTLRCAGVADADVPNMPAAVDEDAAFAGLDLALTVGGDGTMVSMARKLVGKGIPLAGINMGRVGFLTELNRDNWQEALTRALAQGFASEPRLALSLAVKRRGKIIFQSAAVNEVTLARSGIARLPAFDLCLDAAKVLYLRADGVIISTPTGATAYSGSAGGPLIYPSLNAYSVTCICPFINKMPPLVLDAALETSIILREAGTESYVTVDGQEYRKLRAGDVLTTSGLAGALLFARFGVSDYWSKLRGAGLIQDSPGEPQRLGKAK